MKKLYIKLIALFLPVALYMGMFVVFEPYNYFGLKETANTDKDDDSIIGRIIAFNEQQPENLILGDSRMAHFDLDYVAELTGEQYGTLAFGGAAMNETIDLFWYAAENNSNLKRVVIGVSFYHLNKAYYKDRMSQIDELLNNPLAYMFNFNYNVEMLNNLRYALTGVETGASSEEGIWEYADYYYDDGTPRPYRKNLEDYALENIYEVCKEYVLDEEDLADLIKIAEHCNENGIELIFVLPPVDVSIGDLVIKPLGIDADMAYYIPLLEEHARVLNYEYPIYYTDQDLFYDGFHLDPVRGMPGFTQQLFAVDIPNLEVQPIATEPFTGTVAGIPFTARDAQYLADYRQIFLADINLFPEFALDPEQGIYKNYFTIFWNDYEHTLTYRVEVHTATNVGGPCGPQLYCTIDLETHTILSVKYLTWEGDLCEGGFRDIPPLSEERLLEIGSTCEELILLFKEDDYGA